MKILVAMNVEEEHKALLKETAPDAEINYILSPGVTAKDVEDVDVIVGNIAPSLLANCKKLKLMQLNSAGTDGYTKEGVMPEGAVLANATGSYGLAIAEHMIGALLCLMKKLDLYRLEQEKHVWSDHGSVTSIYGSKTLVVGFGDIGGEFAKRMHAMGSTITAIRRHAGEKPDYVEKLLQMDSLYECLKEADIVATCLPGVADTYRVFNAEAFSHMKKGAYFINIGRGNGVDTEALCDALESGHLAGATVDVTDPEPLPADHRLWDCPNLLITPHVSGGYHLRATHDKIVQIAAANITHLLRGEAFDNIVDMKLGYRKNS